MRSTTCRRSRSTRRRPARKTGRPIATSLRGTIRLLTPAGDLAAVAEADGARARTLRVFNYGLSG